MAVPGARTVEISRGALPTVNGAGVTAILRIREILVQPVRPVVPRQRVQQIRPLRAVGRQRPRIADGQRHRHAVIESPDSVRLPSAEHRIEHRIQIAAPMLAASERKIINIRELEHVRDVVLRNRPFQIAAIRILQTRRAAQPRGAAAGYRRIVDRLREHVSASNWKPFEKRFSALSCSA